MAQVWLVTGSSRGLGRAIVEAGLAAGNKVLATARNVESMRDHGVSVFWILPEIAENRVTRPGEPFDR